MQDNPQGTAECFHQLTYVGLAKTKTPDGRRHSKWLCTCGNEVFANYGRVRDGYIKSCGCRVAKPGLSHGMHGTPEYAAWQAMKNRCLSKSNKDYARWGGSGISVFGGWIDDFEAFYRCIGPRPSKKHSLDRIDTLRGYEPGNVRWATATEQSRNRSISKRWNIRGLVFESCGAAAAHFGVTRTTICRWANGRRDDCWTEEKYA